METKEIKLNKFECLFAVFMAFKILKELEEQRRIKKDEDIKKIDSKN